MKTIYMNVESELIFIFDSKNEQTIFSNKIFFNVSQVDVNCSLRHGQIIRIGEL